MPKSKQSQSQILKKIQQLDAQPYPIQLNYKKRHDYKSLTGGVISCLFYIAVMVIVGLNLYYFVTQKQLMFQQVQQRQSFNNITLQRDRFGLRLTVNLKPNISINITKQNQELFGLKVIVQSSNQASYNPSDGFAVNCGNTPYYNFTNYLCFPQKNQNNQTFNMELYGRSDVLDDTKPYHRLGWKVLYNEAKAIQNGFTEPLNVTAQFVFANDLINPKDPNIITNQSIRRIYIRDGQTLPIHQMQHINLFFKKLEVYTDTSLLFFKSQEKKNSTFFDQQLLQTIFTTDQVKDKKIIWIKMKRSLYTVQYFRKYKKIQTFLAETFGVIGLASFIFLIYKGYNKWCFTQKQLVPRNQRQKTNIFKYYAFILKNIRRISLSSQLYSDFEKNLDINRILKRIDRLEKKQNESMIQSQHTQHTHNRQSGEVESMITGQHMDRSSLLKNT